MRCFPDALNEDSTLIGGFPQLIITLVVIEADVAEFVHFRGDSSRGEFVHVPVHEDLDPLVFLQFVVVQMIVVNVDLAAQVRRLSLLDLNQGVASHEVHSLVPVRILIPVLAWAHIVLRLVESDSCVSVLVIRHGHVKVLLKPFDHEVPTLCIGPHPILNKRHAKSNLNDPVSDNLNPLVVGQILLHDILKEDFKPILSQLAEEWRVVDDRGLKHMLEEYQEWAHFVVIEVIEALKDHFKELVCKFMIDEAIVDVGLR